MTYEEFIQQYCIHNHGGEYENDNTVIKTAIRLADNLVNHGLLTPKNK